MISEVTASVKPLLLALPLWRSSSVAAASVMAPFAARVRSRAASTVEPRTSIVPPVPVPLATIVTSRPCTALPTTVSSCVVLVALDLEMPKVAPAGARTGER